MNNLSAAEILLVEDNPQDAELTIRSLKRKNLVNQLVVVEDGGEALEYLFCEGKYAGRSSNPPPKVILLDLKLPKVSGLEVLRALRQDNRTRTIPVVVLTSSSEDPDIATAYSLGANSYVVKPVDFDAFADAVSCLGLYWLLVNQPPRT